MFGYITLVGGYLAPWLLRAIPIAGPRLTLAGLGLLGLLVSHGWVAYKVYAHMLARQEIALKARDSEWRNAIIRSNAEFEKHSQDAINDANKLRDPANELDASRLCDKTAECRDKSAK